MAISKVASHEVRIKKLEVTVDNHEKRINFLENKFSTIIDGIKGISDKLPKHPILGMLLYLGVGIGIGGILILVIILLAYG